jgi:hypothetical protein
MGAAHSLTSAVDIVRAIGEARDPPRERQQMKGIIVHGSKHNLDIHPTGLKT